MNITRSQWLAIAILILSVNMGATSQLSDIFGTGVAKIIVSLSSLGSSILAGIQIILGGQGQQIRDVAAMPGVERISVNANATVAAASVATDPMQPKVGATTPAVRQVILETAKGN